MPNGTKRYTLVIPDDLHARCVEAAKADHRSLNSWILRILDRYGVELNSTVLDSVGSSHDWDGKIRDYQYPTREEKLHS